MPALTLVLVGLLNRSEPPPDPVYKGIPLSEWLSMSGMRLHDWEWKEIGAHPGEAIRAIGTNALPMIESELRIRDSKFRMWLHAVLAKKGWEDRMAEPASSRHSRALTACRYLGDKALPVVHVTAELLSEDVDFQSRWVAARQLAFFGNKASAAIPALEAAVQSKALILWKERGDTNDFAAQALDAIRGKNVDATNSFGSRKPTL